MSRSEANIELVDAVVLAGGKNDPLAKAEAVSSKVALQVGNQPILSYVLRALTQAQLVRKIVVVGPPELKSLLPTNPRVIFTHQDTSLLENVRIGLKMLDSADAEEFVLFVSADVPLLSAKMVDEFLQLALMMQADIVYPIVAKDEMQRRFPQAVRTYVTLKDGTFTGGNLILVRQSVFSSCQDLIRDALGARKKPWKLCRLLGSRFLVSFLLHQLTLKDVEEKVGQLLQCRAQALITDYPEIAFDVDKPSDLQLVREVMNESRSSWVNEFMAQ